MSTPELDTRERVLDGAYTCIARFGIAKTTIDDVVKLSGVSRATIYRWFPGGKEQLLHDVVAWEMARFFGRLAEEIADAPDFATLLEQGLRFAHAHVVEHDVLQKVLVTEPDRLLPLLTTQADTVVQYITAFLEPYLEREAAAGRVRPGVDLHEAAEYLSRMLLSLIGSPGSWDLSDSDQVHRLVSTQLLGGVGPVT